MHCSWQHLKNADLADPDHPQMTDTSPCHADACLELVLSPPASTVPPLPFVGQPRLSPHASAVSFRATCGRAAY